MVDWHKRFLNIAEEVSKWSKDPSTKVGSVIVSRDNTIISTGYNGLPQQADSATEAEILLDRETKMKYIIHAEMNALIFAQQSIKDCTLYNFPLLPCLRCANMFIQAGVKTFVAPKLSIHDARFERWGKELEESENYIKKCGGKVIFPLDETEKT